MKYPALLPLAEIDLDAFDTIIDARTPLEFAEDRLPGAINCPVLDDEQRVTIGTMYKQVGSFEAKKLGAALVARNIAHHLETVFHDKPRDWKPLIYCWRGGNRSGSMAHILAKVGWPAVQLEGGYKAFRQHVVATLPALAEPLTFRVVCGTTGSGKSRLLQALARAGAQVLDLEQLAAHRGSVLGGLPEQPQPSQKAFETAIWQALRRFDPSRPVFVESESKKVGALRVPDCVMDKMRASACIALDLARDQRVQLLMEDYEHFVRDYAPLNAQLAHLASLHGNEKIGRWHALAESGEMHTLVDELLAEHYDPAYLRSIGRNFTRYEQARAVTLDGIDETAMERAAKGLIGAGD